ncbi:hypothetical protein [Streptomyces noursei]|uniref:hypothetical protein n=1 Tax=Streptomyces noursei TaxID=1971 RepID=UPI0035E0F997
MTAPASPDQSTPHADRPTTYDDQLRRTAPVDVATIQTTISEALHGSADFAPGQVTVWW